MFEAEVHVAVPQTRRSSSPEPLHNGARANPVLEGVEIFDRHFTAKYCFLDQALHQVTPSTTPTPSGSEGEVAVHGFKTALDLRYGAEADARSVKDARGVLLTATGIHGPTNIQPVFLSVVGEPEHFNSVCQARLGNEAAKL